MTIRAVAPSLLGWPVCASVATHVAGVGVVALVGLGAPAAPPPPEPASVEVVRIEPPPPPPSPAPRRPAIREKLTPAPRLVTKPEPVVAPESPVAPLLEDAPRRQSTPGSADSGGRFLGGGTIAGVPISGLSAGSSKGHGALLSTGDLPIGSAGNSGDGGAGPRSGARPEVASTGSGGNPDGLTAFARPLGGYQTRPRYPDAARREGIEGDSLLRFEVLATGRVGAIAVARSAGHPDLDRAAMEAVKTWLFEPARRGKEPVTVWVTLPVRFRLQSGVGE